MLANFTDQLGAAGLTRDLVEAAALFGGVFPTDPGDQISAKFQAVFDTPSDRTIDDLILSIRSELLFRSNPNYESRVQSRESSRLLMLRAVLGIRIAEASGTVAPRIVDELTVYLTDMVRVSGEADLTPLVERLIEDRLRGSVAVQDRWIADNPPPAQLTVDNLRRNYAGSFLRSAAIAAARDNRRADFEVYASRYLALDTYSGSPRPARIELVKTLRRQLRPPEPAN